ncbi:hypothetical protein [Thiothrix fructosivorans]|uniref:STAS/SEC14 domain-containing protein n=1 Tax=Thiothrix fructosivorans TaxID=111770 RepID=A0A8B0SKP7_9GAMM|nr:hypothetical protein [Thiothrix fructosivorans]MBO0612934.1 hypothetical protein [Thiothrix fructosivorans]QTX11615.1 hypothetical protein J1836_004490 [Thiothrix fructosivorans]
MSSIQITSQVSTDELLHGVESLPIEELEQFVARVLALCARRKANSLSTQETRLLQLINRPVPSVLQSRYDALIQQQRAGTLTHPQGDELNNVIEQIELFDAERVQHLVSLAALRQVSIDKLMKDLGIRQPDYV